MKTEKKMPFFGVVKERKRNNLILMTIECLLATIFLLGTLLVLFQIRKRDRKTRKGKSVDET